MELAKPWGYIGIMEKKMEITIMENQMEKKMENEMEKLGLLFFTSDFLCKFSASFLSGTFLKCRLCQHFQHSDILQFLSIPRMPGCQVSALQIF